MTAVWAHRGASADAPENTLAAFALAVEQGADGVELDVQLTADGQVVVCHDETLDRTTDGSGRLATRTLADLHLLDAGDGQAIPTLGEVLALLAPTGMSANIELKNSVEPYPGLTERVVEVVRASSMASRVWYSSFALETLPEVVRLTPTSHVGILVTRARAAQAIAAARRIGATAVHPHQALLRVPGWVDAVHDAGLLVHAWTVDTERDVQRAARLGVDAIITNRPAAARAALG